MTLRKVSFLILALLLATTTGFPVHRSFSPPPPPPSVAGLWDFKLDVNRMVGKDGFVRKQLRSFEWVIRLKQEGGKVTGDLIGGKGSRGESVCADGDVRGAINGTRIELVVAYQGNCCSQEQEKFVGEVDDSGKTINGTLEPVDVPRAYDCSLAYADVKGTKR